MRITPTGSGAADIMIVGEYPTADEDHKGTPFVGAAGHELTKMLEDAGLSRLDCYLTTAIKVQPPWAKPPLLGIDQWISDKKKPPNEDDVLYLDSWVRPFIVDDIKELFAEIEQVKPKVIIALGNTALWALTGHDSVSKWRGSQMLTAADRPLSQRYKVVPTHHPAAILRMWAWRHISVLDMMRAKREVTAPHRPIPTTESLIAPSYEGVCAFLAEIEARLATGKVKLTLDLEIKRGTVLCVGLGVSRYRAMCIPFWHEIAPLAFSGEVLDTWTAKWALKMLDNPHTPVTVRYFPWEQELAIIMRLRAILLHPNMDLINQNLGFELQFISTYWACLPTVYFDTMIAQHVMLPGTPKALDYLHSIYGQEYLYWKDDAKTDGDDGKFWKDNAKVNYRYLWTYNCKDCLNTFEVYEAQEKSIDIAKLRPQFNLQMRKLNHFSKVMYRGVRVNDSMRNAYLSELVQLIAYTQYEVEYYINRSININSPKQLMDFFYGTMRQPVIMGKENRPTCDDEALKIIGLREPILRPVTDRMNLIRSYGTSVNVCKGKTSRHTNRWHTDYHTAGAETIRCSSSQNVWNEAVNTQNLTKGKEIAK